MLVQLGTLKRGLRAGGMAGVSDTLESLLIGSRVWVRMDGSAGGWAAAVLRTIPSADALVAVHLLDGSQLEVGADRLQPANPPYLDDTSDLCQLSYLNEPSVLSVLKQRYAADKIYTFAGNVLIALNPCKQVDLYTPEIAAGYQGGARRDLQYASLPMSQDPHIFLVAAEAFRALVREGSNQSLVISGESGAGKTETAKKAMQFFTSLAGGTGMEEAVLQTTPILEAFGNAKTNRNNNSSRFGKLIDIQFNHAHRICGAGIRTYLLEKSRVVRQLPGERNYHIFYQLIAGARGEEREHLGMPASPSAFRFLAQSCSVIPGVDDAAELRTVREALSRVGLQLEAQKHIMEVVAAVLWLGNLDFQPHDYDETAVEEGEAFNHAWRLLGVTPKALRDALTKRTIRTRDESVVRSCRLAEAQEGRDALAKTLYATLFNWIVEQINSSLSSGKRSAGLTISVLDIFGFEDFSGANSFEQLCINYTNERLQQLFNQQLFTMQQMEYASEGIHHAQVTFEDNSPAVDLIDQKSGKLGLLQLLDAICRFPRASDSQFMNSVRQQMPRPRLGVNPRQPEFVVTHFAGDVAYQAAGMVDKNKDAISQDLVDLLVGSSQVLVQSLGRSLQEDLSSAQRSQRATVGLQFAEQLRELVAHLAETGLHFVRCIKPNEKLVADVFEPGMMLNQLRCCGVLEVVRMAKGGFPSRMAFQPFVQRYCVLLPGLENLREGETARDAALRLLNGFHIAPDQYLMGRNKTFFRPGVLGQIDDRWAVRMRISSKLQTSARCWQWRTWFLKERRSAVAVQTAVRGRHARRMYLQMCATLVEAKRTAAASKIQRTWRSLRIRATFREILRAMVAVAGAMKEEAKARQREEEENNVRRQAEAEASQSSSDVPAVAVLDRKASLDTAAANFGLDFHEMMEALAQFSQQKAAKASQESSPAVTPRFGSAFSNGLGTPPILDSQERGMRFHSATMPTQSPFSAAAMLQHSATTPRHYSGMSTPTQWEGHSPLSPNTPPPFDVPYPAGLEPVAVAVIAEQNARMAALTAQVEVLVNAMSKMQQLQAMQAQTGVTIGAVTTPAPPATTEAKSPEVKQQNDNRGTVRGFMGWLVSKLPF